MQIWPFRAIAPLAENHGWLTNVMRSPAAEQRLSLRATPRVDYQLTHNLSAQEYAAAQAMLRNGHQYDVPGWPHGQRVGVVSPGTDVVVSVTHDDAGLTVGSRALLWESSTSFESVVIAATDAGSVTIVSVSDEYTNPQLLPLFAGQAPSGLEVSRSAGGFIQANIRLELTENGLPAAGSYTQYRGIDVLVDKPVVGSGAFSQPFSWELQSIDNKLGIPYYQRALDYPDSLHQMRWRASTRTQKLALRQWLAARRGKQKAFWFSSRNVDLIAPAGVSSVATVLPISPLPGVSDLGRSVFDIEIVTASGAVFYRQILDVVADAGLLNLQMASALGVTLTAGDILRISYLHCVRQNTDRITLNHRDASGSSVSVPLIECPVPV